MGSPLNPALSLLDWRRQIAALYAAVRATKDPAAAHHLWCSGRNELLRTHAQSPIPLGRRSEFAGAQTFPYDRQLRFETEFVPADPLRIDVPTGTDGVVSFDRIGRVRLGAVGELDVWWLAGYGGGVFLPLRDGTAGTETYGGGRYLLDTAKGADLGGGDGALVVDLNFAYNPSCAYDPAWACPLAPAGNVLEVKIRAGEMTA